MKKKIRIAIYARQAKLCNEKSYIDNQINLILRYINVHYPKTKYEAEIEIFVDAGFSGRTIDRPGFQKMLKRERKQSFNVLAVYRLDRLGRNMEDFLNLTDELRKLHTNLISVKEQFDMNKADEKFNKQISEIEAEIIK